jgi:protein disulfide-isomerase A6
VRGYPTIKFFGANKKRPEDYQGAREAPAIVDFANEKFSAQLPPPEVGSGAGPAAPAPGWLHGPSFTSPFADPPLPPLGPQVKELTGAAVFEKECTKAGRQLCFLAFLPDILDTKASGRSKWVLAPGLPRAALRGSARHSKRA